MNLVEQQICINLRAHRHKSFTETSRKSWRGLLNSLLSTSNLWSISRVEVINCLFRGQLWNRRQNWKCIACKENYIFWMSSNCWNLCVVNKLKWIAGSGILSDWSIEIVDLTGCCIKSNVLKNSSEFDCIVNFWLFFST